MRVKLLNLVLLGDIFELLKSRKWLDSRLRPWQASTGQHQLLVTSILESVAQRNEQFFERLRSLVKSYPFLKLTYIPGNHDHLLMTEMGSQAKQRLLAKLPVEFEPFFQDEEILAKHGHEWDPTNRYGASGWAIGDAIVIELIVRFPLLVAERLGAPENDPQLEFLFQLDNVRPQAPRRMAQWMLGGLDRIKDRYPNAGGVIQQSAREVITRLNDIQNEARFESFETATWWIRFLSLVAALAVGRIGALRSALQLPVGGESAGPYFKFARDDLQGAIADGTECSYILCGHTHNPEIVPIEVTSGGGARPAMYLNTGTWRRMLQRAEEPAKGSPGIFVSRHEECFVIVHDSEEQRQFNVAAYEFHCTTNGRLS